MKKIGAFLLTLASCLALVSCGSKKKADPTTTTAPTTTVAPDPTPTTNTYKSKSVSEVMQNIGSKLTLRVDLPDQPTPESGNFVKVDVTLAVNGNRVCLSSPDGKVYFREADGIKSGTVGMFVDDGMYAYNGVYAVPASTIESYIDFEEALSIACGLNITYDTKNENFEFIGRQCTQYFYSHKIGNDEVTEEWDIDNLTGMCLKHSIIKTDSTEIINETTFEVKEMALGDKVDEFFDAEDSLIIIEPFDSKFLGEHGLVTKTEDEKSYFIISDILAEYDEDKTMPTLYLDKSASPYTEGKQYGHETTYILEGTDTVKADFATFILDRIYTYGAKYNATGSIASIGELTIEYEEEDSICMGYSLQAFTDSNARYLVNLEYGTDETMFGSKTTLSISLVDLTMKPKDVYPYSYEYKTKTTEEIIENLNGTYVMDVKYPIYQDEKYSLFDVTIGKNNGDMILQSPGEIVYLENKSETEWYAFDFNGALNGYNIVSLDKKEDWASEDILLGIACELDIDFNFIEVNVEFLGRTCTRFINTYKDIDDETITEEYIIDNITGICLKHEYKKGNDVIVNESSFEVTSFNLNSESVAQSFNAEKGLIKVDPWDADFLADCGFAEIKEGTTTKHTYELFYIKNLLNNENIDLEFDFSMTNYNSSNEKYYHKVEVLIEDADGKTATDEEKGLYAMGIITNMAFCGVKYDASGNATNFDENYTDSSWDGVLSYSEKDGAINYIQLEGFNDSEKNIVVELTYTLDIDGTAEITLEITDKSKDPRN